MISADAVPASMAERETWLCWRTEVRDGDETKIPVDPNGGGKASVSNPDTWADFDGAKAYHDDPETGTTGIGFVFTDDGPFTGVDLDDCRDPRDGTLEQWALDVVNRLDSYTEVSPSGTGIHVIVVGELPPGGNRSGKIEMYDTARFFTFTGDALLGRPDEPAERQDVLESVHSEYIAGEEPDESETIVPPDPPPELTLGDDELVEKAKNADDGGKFRRLWDGDTSGYPSHSEADQALCYKLAFWTAGDRNRIDDLFRRSGLYREKWERDDYRERTIGNAVDNQTEFYSPTRSAPTSPSVDPSTLDRLSPSELREHHLDGTVRVEGDMTKVTAIQPLVRRAAFECPCGEYEYVNQTMTSARTPYGPCSECDREAWSFDIGESTVVDHRKLKLEEPPEDRARSASVSVPVYVLGGLCHCGGDNGLADHGGERIVVTGEYTSDTSGYGSKVGPLLTPYLKAESIEFVNESTAGIDVDENIDEIEAFASGDRGDPVELCKASIAPRLHVTDELDAVLEAAVAWLFNAYRIEVEGDHIRGDLHLGLIGDPATGKSTILSNLSRIAPKCEYRSAAGLTKAGMTAAAIQEEFAGKSEWVLEPGVLPRSNGGHCIVDEIDHLVDDKTKAIHDALEGEQTVKIDKAGISANLPTRTAFLASGNPVHGRYDPYEPVPEQIDMDPALVSRLDVLLALRDRVDPDHDERVADQIISAWAEMADIEVAERNDDDPPDAETVDRPVPVDVFRAWVYHARETCFPRMSDDATDELREFYREVRNLNDGYAAAGDSGTIPATARTLESGIRLATAFARVELSETVEPRHAERAIAVSRATVGVNFDPSTGEFDAARVDTGTPKSQVDRRDVLRGIIGSLTEQADGPNSDGVPIDDVLDEAESAGIDRTAAEHDIEKWSERGEVAKPAYDRVRLT